MTTQVFDEQAIKDRIQIDSRFIPSIEQGYVKLSHGEATMPPIMRIDVPEHNGEVDIKSAYIPGFDGFAVKLSSGFFDNPKKGLPSGSGLMVLIDSETGQPRAVFLDNGHLTDIRTGIAGAIAAKHLSSDNEHTIGIVGTGKQARFQLRAISQVKNVKQAYVYGRRTDSAQQYANDMQQELGIAQQYANDMQQELGITVQPVDSIAQLASHASILVTTTPATEPIIKPEHLHSGMLIIAMGSDAEHKNEVDPRVLTQVDQVVCDSEQQCERLGELHHVDEQGLREQLQQPVAEIGQIIQRPEQYNITAKSTVLCDLTGTGAQDTAIALEAHAILGG